MDLRTITPLILTYNEAANIRATLEGINWASQILLIDSFSTDATLAIAAEFPQVRIVQRPFDHFANQCNFGLTLVETTWVLSMDADYKCGPAFAEELARLDSSLAGYRAPFLYGIYGQPLRATLYPPRLVLYQANCAEYFRDGHAHRVLVDGEIGAIKAPILHDDWKPLSVWLESQLKYAGSEADKLCTTQKIELGWKDRIRRRILFAPPLTLAYCLLVKGLILDGWRGIFYSLQRTFAELALSLVLLDRKLRKSS